MLKNLELLGKVTLLQLLHLQLMLHFLPFLLLDGPIVGLERVQVLASFVHPDRLR